MVFVWLKFNTFLLDVRVGIYTNASPLACKTKNVNTDDLVF